MAKDIEPKLKLISEYLKIDKNEIFVIPEYQRGYSWLQNEQCDKLWQDIENFVETDSTDDPYFFGTIIIDCSESDKSSLIDGQQRTITFLLLLKALLLRLKITLKELKVDESSEGLKASLEECRNNIIDILYKTDGAEKRHEILKDWKNVKNISFLENKSINESYKDELKIIIEAEDFETAEKGCCKIKGKQKDNKYTNFFKNFKFFYQKLEEYSETQLNEFAKIFLKRCQIIEIKSWKVEQAITMFNSLNSTGMPLSDADIISAQMYSHVEENSREAFNERWKYIRNLAKELEESKIINISSVLQQYMYINRSITKEYIKGSYTDVTMPGVRKYYTIINENLLKKPIELCKHFTKIVEIWDKIKDYPVIKLLLKFNENAKLYLISYLYRYEPSDIDEEKIVDVAECLLRLFCVLDLLNTAYYSSTNIKTFLLTENIKLVDKNICNEEIIEDFNNHIRANWNEDEIEHATFDYNKNAIVFLNEYLYAKSKKLSFNFENNVNVEHIMPCSGHNLDSIRKDAGIATKDEFDLYANRLGNKILLEEKINKSISNEWFKTKKQNSIRTKSGYKDSSYHIAQKLVEYLKDSWTKDDIDLATGKIAKRLIQFIFNK